MHDLESGEVQTYEIGDGEKLPIERDFPPICSSCPKKQIDLEGRLKLDPRNDQAVSYWEMLKIMGGAKSLPQHLNDCDVFASRMLMIQRAWDTSKANAKRRAIEKARQESEMERR